MLTCPHERPAVCASCDLGALGKGFSLPAGPATSRILAVGESLGAEEVKFGEPFMGAAGGMLSKLLSLAGIERDAIRLDNVIRCQPPKNYLDGAPWELQSTDWCSRHHLAASLRNLPAGGVVVPLGGVATRKLLSRTKKRFKLDNWHATVTYIPPGEGLHGTGDYYVVPTYHPSFLQRGATNLTQICTFALSRAADVAARGWKPVPYSCVIDPPVAWFAAWVDMIEAMSRSTPWKWWLPVDVETPDKAKGKAEDELSFEEDRSYQITHWNFAIDPNEGVTVPHYGEYIPLVDRLLGTQTVKLFWHMAYDRPRILTAGHQLAGWNEGKVWDLMLAAHALQSDVPLGLGFWGPLVGDQPAWKHLYQDDFGTYRAFDGFVPLRAGHVIVNDLIKEGLWDGYRRHMVDLDRFALIPAVDVGLRVDRDRLLAFKAKLEAKTIELLDQIQTTAPAGKLSPPGGLTHPPKEGAAPQSAKPKRKGEKRNVKQDWVGAKFSVIAKDIPLDVRCCATCGEVGVSVKHRCQPRVALDDLILSMWPSASFPGEWRGKKVMKFHPTPNVVIERRTVTRYFFLEPFNVDSPQQLLQLILSKGHTPGVHKKTQKATTEKKTLEKLEATTRDPFYRYALDYRAVTKVRTTYVEGTEKRMKWHEEEQAWRLHGEVTHRPSTRRTSMVNPNLQNVVSDRGGKLTLAAGFRTVIVPEPAA